MSSGQMASRQANGSGTARGDGLGKGSGFGDRPETESETNTYQTQVQGKLTEGKSVIAGIADGPNRKGVSREDLKQAIKASLKEQGESVRESSDSESGERACETIFRSTPRGILAF